MDRELSRQELEDQLQQARRNNDDLSSLLRSTELVNSTLDLNAVLDYLMKVATDLTDSEAASALLIEEDRLSFVAASGVKSADVKKVYLHKGEGIAGWVAEHGEPLIIANVSADARFSGSADRASGFVTRSILAVPLKIENMLIGVVEAVNKKNAAGFTEHDVRLLSALAGSAAIALHKAQMYRDQNELFISTILSLANALEAKDLYTRGHSERIRDFSVVIAREMGMSADDQRQVEIAALLHDIGKIGVPEHILHKKSRLNDEEFLEIQKHPVIGADILGSIKQLKNILPAIRHHQERYDGAGYPSKLKGENIPFLARMIAVADTFDAMTSNRPYRGALTDTTAVDEIRRLSGIQFDPDCAAAFIRGFDKGLIKSIGSRQDAQKDSEISGA